MPFQSRSETADALESIVEEQNESVVWPGALRLSKPIISRKNDDEMKRSKSNRERCFRNWLEKIVNAIEPRRWIRFVERRTARCGTTRAKVRETSVENSRATPRENPVLLDDNLVLIRNPLAIESQLRRRRRRTLPQRRLTKRKLKRASVR